jgi:Outer membrane lipoprotein carrier protein LolA-like
MRSSRVAVIAFALAAQAASATPPSLTLAELLSRMASTRGVVAEFHEQKEIALLDRPLESAGTIYFAPPDRFTRVTRSPAVTRLVLDGARMRFEDATGADAVDLGANPVARQFAENMVALWSGDRARLEKLYELDFRAEQTRWELVLVPRDGTLARFVERLAMRGDGAEMRELELVERDGDRTLTQFLSSDVDHAFSADEASKIFGVEAPK